MCSLVDIYTTYMNEDSIVKFKDKFDKYQNEIEDHSCDKSCYADLFGRFYHKKDPTKKYVENSLP